MTAREAAFRALSAYRRTGARPDAALGALVEKHAITRRDAALAMQITGGVMQNMALCDYYTASCSSLSLKKTEPRVLDILRLSVYQIVFLSKIPHRAAVSEGVALARKHANPAAAGYVNAVLRNVASAAAGGTLPEPGGPDEHRLSVKYSHPEWLVREICLALGTDNAEKLLAANNAPDVPVTAQVNTLLADTGAVTKLLEADGVKATPHEWLTDCVEMRGAGRVDRLEAFRKGYIYVQDAASRLVIMAAAPEPDSFVIDGCAAPGGKSFAAAIAMKNKGRIVSTDVSGQKLRLVAEGAARLGINIIKAVEADAASGAVGFHDGADVVIADVPCSGFGVIRKKPEIRYKPQNETDALPELQKRILASLSACVKPGGTLIYSTCTFLGRENEDVVDRFLEDHSDFRAECFSLPGAGAVPGGMLTLWPHINGTDGFFICKMRRKLTQ